MIPDRLFSVTAAELPAAFTAYLQVTAVPEVPRFHRKVEKIFGKLVVAPSPGKPAVPVRVAVPLPTAKRQSKPVEVLALNSMVKKKLLTDVALSMLYMPNLATLPPVEEEKRILAAEVVPVRYHLPVAPDTLNSPTLPDGA